MTPAKQSIQSPEGIHCLLSADGYETVHAGLAKFSCSSLLDNDDSDNNNNNNIKHHNNYPQPLLDWQGIDATAPEQELTVSGGESRSILQPGKALMRQFAAGAWGHAA